MPGKTRFTASDIRAMVVEMRLLIGQRASNVYDINDKTYLIKFAVPGDAEKPILLVESGVRFHLTKYVQAKNDMPSPFTMKLRKYIRTKRLEDVKQLASDRVVDFKFGSGDSVIHIILELYAQGNIIMTNGEYEILALVRSHQFNDSIAIKVGAVYPVAFATSLSSFLTQSTDAGIDTNTVDDTEPVVSSVSTLSIGNTWESFLTWMTALTSNVSASDIVEKGKTAKKSKPMTVLAMLMHKNAIPFASFGTDIIHHCLLQCEIDPSERVSDLLREAIDSRDQITRLQYCYNMFLPVATVPMQLQLQLDTPGQKAFIQYKPLIKSVVENPSTVEVIVESTTLAVSAASLDPSASSHSDKEFMEFFPRILNQYTSQQYLTFNSFSEAVDEYFCQAEGQRLLVSAIQTEDNIKKKIDKVRNEQDHLIQQLAEQQNMLYHSAMCTEVYAEEIDAVCTVVNSALESGMSWNDIQDMVHREATVNHNPYAQLVHSLNFKKNVMILRLPNVSYEEDDEEMLASMDENASSSTIATPVSSAVDIDVDGEIDSGLSLKKQKQKLKQQKQSSKSIQAAAPIAMPTIPIEKQSHLLVEIDLSVSAYANACKLYGNKKQAQLKEQKTILNAEKAVAGVERAAEKQLNKANIKRQMHAVRKVHWFEKFNWFVTTQGYLCLSGRDAQQNEMLVKKYMEPYDAYIHADIAGAASCIVKAKRMDVQSEGDTGKMSTANAQSQSTSTGVKTILSPIALQEAAVNCISRSIAWDNKVVIAAWWVWGSQVSKTPPTGEYLTTGSFMIYGKKNFLSPSSLEMGFGVMFRLDDESVARRLHQQQLKERDVEGRKEGGGKQQLYLDADVLSSISAHKQTTNQASVGEQSNKYGIDYSVMLSNDQYDAKSSANSSTAVNCPSQSTTNSNSGKIRISAADRKAMKKNSNADTSKGVEVIVIDDVTPAVVDLGDDEEQDDEEDDNNVECDEVDSDEEFKPKPLSISSLRKQDGGTQASYPSSAQTLPQGKNNTTSSGKHNDKSKSTATNKSKQTTVDDSETATSASASIAGGKKKEKGGKVQRKKARRYAEQDEEDRYLAMQALGHIKIEDTDEGKDQREQEAAAQLASKHVLQQAAGIALLADYDKQQAELLYGSLPSNIRVLLIDIEAVVESANSSKTLTNDKQSNQSKKNSSSSGGKNSQTDNKDKDKKAETSASTFLSNSELKSLAALSESDAIAILVKFKKSLNGNNKNRNKSGLLAEIMTEFMIQKSNMSVHQNQEAVESSEDISAGETTDTLSRRAWKRQEQEEIQHLLDEEGIHGDYDSKESAQNVQETEKLTGFPFPEDVILFAVPVCGPYVCMQGFKYKVKLTPGTNKKGKAVKQAIEMFTRDGGSASNQPSHGYHTNASASSVLIATEKTLIKQLTDPECVAIMIGDVKLSVPGLYQKKK